MTSKDGASSVVGAERDPKPHRLSADTTAPPPRWSREGAPVKSAVDQPHMAILELTRQTPAFFS